MISLHLHWRTCLALLLGTPLLGLVDLDPLHLPVYDLVHQLLCVLLVLLVLDLPLVWLHNKAPLRASGV